MPENLAPALCLLVPLYGNLGANFIICSQIANKVLFLPTVLQACANALQFPQPRSAQCPLLPAGQQRALRLVFPGGSPLPRFSEECVAFCH